MKTPTPKTDITPYKGHPAFYWAGGLVTLVLLAVMCLIAAHGVPAWEHSLDRSINAWPGSWHGAFEAVTNLGAVWAAPLFVGVAFLARYYRLAWRLALSLIGSYGAVFILKHLVGRERPAQLFSDIHARVHETGMGFPSNHTTAITVIMLTLLPYLPWRWRWFVPIPILAVALSRVYLGVHLPLDVIGAMALGALIVSAVRLLPQALRVLLRID